MFGKMLKNNARFFVASVQTPQERGKKSNESSTGKVKQQMQMAIITPFILRISTFLMRQIYKLCQSMVPMVL
jgi:hypothetical protein